jgi:hypothetical protein
MNFIMQRVEYDPAKERAYVEFRGPDDDGGDAITVALFSYRKRSRGRSRQAGPSGRAAHLTKAALPLAVGTNLHPRLASIDQTVSEDRPFA